LQLFSGTVVSRPAWLCRLASDNSLSDKHLNGLSNRDNDLKSKRLESRACENCRGNLEDELLYNGGYRVSASAQTGLENKVSAAIEETSHKHW
jgi:hypothetical protein